MGDLILKSIRGIKPNRCPGILALLGLLVLAACWTDDGPTGPGLAVEETHSAALELELLCTADLRAGTVACHSPEASLPAGANGLIIGRQGELVELRSENVLYTPQDSIFQADVYVKNLMLQALGTVDGETPAAEGVRVFFHNLPVATTGTGEVEVLDADGYAAFSRSDQPYYQYDQVLGTGEESAPRQWKWRVPETVETFWFSVFISAPVQYSDGWIDLDGSHLLAAPGETYYKLTATPRNAYGEHLEGATVIWESSNPAVATIDAEGGVNPIARGMATLTARVAGIAEIPAATATVTVVNESLLAGAARIESLGQGSRISASPGSGLDQAIEASAELTVEGWFRSDFSSGMANRPIFAKGWFDPASGTNQGFGVMAFTGGYLVAERTANGMPQSIFFLDHTLEDDRWYHLALVMTATDWRLYLDGELVEAMLQPMPMLTMLPDRFQVGCQAWDEGTGCQESYYGDIDEIRVWGAALDAETLAEWKNRPVTGRHPAFGDLLAYWPFDDGEGRVVADLSGRGAHGEVEGSEPSWITRENRIRVNPESLYFATEGESAQLTVSMESAFGETHIPTAVSTNPSVASVDEKMLVTAGAEDGVAQIVVSAPGFPDAVIMVQKGPVYVDASATGANDGSSWEDAFVDLQDALNGPAAEIWVAKGTYRPAQNDDPNAVFRMRSGQAVYGGFDGTETAREQRRWWANETVLTGRIKQGQWRQQIVLAQDVDSTGVLDGFTLTEAWATGMSAAITVEGGAPTFRNLRIRENTGGGTAAAGFYVTGGSPSIYNVAITNNFGAALLATGGASPVLTNVTSLASGDVSLIARGAGSGISLRNSIVWYSLPGGLKVVRAEDGGLLHIQNAFIEGGCPQFAICEDVDSINPGFVDQANYDARLRATSIAIDKGRVDFLPADAADLDLAGNPRVYGDAVDLGAWEVQSPPDWAPVGILNKTEHDFGEVFRGHASDWETFQITSTGTGLLSIDSIEVVGEAAGNFNIALNYCDGASLPPGSSCGVSVEFVPQGSGSVAAHLRFNHNGADGYSEAELRGTVRSNIVYVNHAATGANDGTSWEDAYTDLEAALRFLQSGYVEGIEIWVAQGIYKPSQTGDRSADFTISQNISLYGGFNGTETSLDQRKWWAHPTILSGDIGVEGDDSDNSYRVLSLRNTASRKYVDGFIIEGARNTRGGQDGWGGGIWCGQCTATVRNVIVRDNQAVHGGAMAGSGSADLAQLLVINSVIAGNSSTGDGGAIYAASGVNVRLENTTVHANTAGGRGGAAFAENLNGPTRFFAYNSIFWNNTSNASDGEDEIHLTAPHIAVRHEIRNSILANGCGDLTNCSSTVSADPLFVDPLGPDGIAGTADDDLRLQIGSPAISLGNLNYLESTLDRIHDLLGQPRVVGTIDAGAIEFQEP